MTLATACPAIEVFKRALRGISGERLARVVLFGSLARGEATAESDVDLLIVLRDFVEPGREIDRMIDAVMEVEASSGVHISPVPIAEIAFLMDVTPLLVNIRRDGTAV